MNRDFSAGVLDELSSFAEEGKAQEVAPQIKVAWTAGYLLLTVSFGRYDWIGTFVFAVIPYFFAAVTGVGIGRLVRNVARALPFVCCAGIGELFLDRASIALWNAPDGWRISGGVIAFAVLLAKTFGTVGAVMLLTANLSFAGLADALVRLGIPCILVLQIQLLCRYLDLAVSQFSRMMQAYHLRNPRCRRIPVKDFGMLAGQLFLRTNERAEGIYAAMQCRLFHAGRGLSRGRAGTMREWLGAGMLFLVLAAGRWWL
ncbi:MAG: energy-coupling factor transporter transmembrane component T [Victivallaceae bacterium]|nr:energy-coupling factor transporter transmembrane component T [Victivallaceae bacterium]